MILGPSSIVQTDAILILSICRAPQLDLTSLGRWTLAIVDCLLRCCDSTGLDYFTRAAVSAWTAVLCQADGAEAEDSDGARVGGAERLLVSCYAVNEVWNLENPRRGSRAKVNLSA